MNPPSSVGCQGNIVILPSTSRSTSAERVAHLTGWDDFPRPIDQRNNPCDKKRIEQHLAACSSSVPHPLSSQSNKYILTLVDHFSKWAEAIPLRNHTAPVVAKALMTHVLSRFGAPCQLLTDRGAEFESELFSQLMSWIGTDKLQTTVFKPSTNATVERFHRTLNAMLASPSVSLSEIGTLNCHS